MACFGRQQEAAGGQQAVHVVGGHAVLHAAGHEPVAKGVVLRAQRHHRQAVTRVLHATARSDVKQGSLA